jgi:hypothetical protein
LEGGGRTLRPVQPEPVAVTAEAQRELALLQRTVLERLRAQDADQEVKEAVIVCEGMCLCARTAVSMCTHRCFFVHARLFLCARAAVRVCVT